MKILILLLLSLFTLDAKEKIVSLSPAITEIVYALEKGDSLVATSSYSLHPKKAQTLRVIGGYENPNIEKILALSPTLVIGQTFNQNTLEKLRYFKIKTLMLNLKTIENIKKSIHILASELNSKHDTKLIQDIEDATTKASKNKTPHSVMIVYGLREDLRSSTYIAGHDIFFEDIIKLSGNSNAYSANTTSQPVLNYENIIALNPEQIIILHSHATEPNVDVKKALKSWYAIPTKASKNANISIVDENYLHIPSHRVALTIKVLSNEMNKNYNAGD